MTGEILASWTPLQTQRIGAGMQIADGFHYAVQRLVGLVGSGSAPLIIHDGPRLSWLCPRVRRLLALTFPRRLCLRFAQLPRQEVPRPLSPSP